jgi:hypothetical protein
MVDRSTEMSEAQFHHYWECNHADVIRDMRQFGLVGYIQDHALDTLAVGERELSIAGFSQTWWSSAAEADIGKRDPASFKRMVNDEAAFLSGLTGFLVASPESQLSAPYFKIWLHDLNVSAEKLQSLALALESSARAELSKVFLRDPTSVVVRREGLGSLGRDPSGVIAFHYNDLDTARFALAQIAAQGRKAGLSDAYQLALTREVRVVSPR